MKPKANESFVHAVRDDKLNIRIPRGLKEQLEAELAEKQSQTPYRIEWTDFVISKLEKKGDPMKTISILILVLLSGAAEAVSPRMCALMCQKMNAGKSGAKCDAAVIDGLGPAIFVEAPAKADPDTELLGHSLLECFFAAGGQSWIIHFAGEKVYNQCNADNSRQGYSCSGGNPDLKSFNYLKDLIQKASAKGRTK